MQPKINRDLGVLFGRSPALAPATMLDRMYRSQEEADAERAALDAAHLATLARRAAWQQTATQEEADEPILATAFTAKSLLHPTPQQSAAIARWAAANNLQESML